MEPVSQPHFFLEGKHSFTADGSPGMNTEADRVDNPCTMVGTSQTDPVLHYHLTLLEHRLILPDTLPRQTATRCYC